MRAIICDLCRNLIDRDTDDGKITLKYEGGMGEASETLDLHRTCLARIHSGDFEDDET